jgi:hypothetical protein
MCSHLIIICGVIFRSSRHLRQLGTTNDAPDSREVGTKSLHWKYSSFLVSIVVSRLCISVRVEKLRD